MKKIFSLFAALTLSAGLWATPASVSTDEIVLATGNWEAMSWANQPKILESGVLGAAGAKAGQTLRIYVTPAADNWLCQVVSGWWSAIGTDKYPFNTEDSPYDLAAHNGALEIVLDDYNLAGFDLEGIVINGDGLVITKVALKNKGGEQTAPVVGDQFEDATSGLKFEVTAVGDTNTVMVITNNYTGTSYTVPDTVKYLDVDFAVTEIGESAFERCSSLESVTLPEGLLTIGENAFEECSALQTITIPASVTEIGVDAFNSSALQSITIPAGVTEIGGTAFCGCESLQSVTLSEGLLTIGEAAFQSCVSLQSITIPAGVTTIGMAAFAGSGLQTITIPAGVISLGMGAFAECAGLTSVTFLGNACQDAIGELAFYEVGKDAPALLTLHGTWAKENQPDEDGNWYGGKFELSSDPTALPTLFGDGVKGNKFMHNGHLFIRKGDRIYTILGPEK